METIRFYREQNVVDCLRKQGECLRIGIDNLIARHGLADYFELIGRPCNLIYSTKDAQGKPSQAFRTLFLQELIRGGILAPSFVVSFSHTDEDIDRTIDAVDQALGIYLRALQDGIDTYLVGRLVRPVNRKYA